MDLRDNIRAYIVENFLFGDAGPLQSDGMSLLDSGIIDSVGVMELVAFLEKTYGIHVEDMEMVPENLDTLASIEKYIRSKLS